MPNYVRKLLQDAEAAGFKMEVWSGGDEADYNGHHPASAEEAVRAVDEAHLYLRDAEGRLTGWALLIGDLDDDEVIADCGEEDWIDRWWRANIL